jgi:hypothetical protein
MAGTTIAYLIVHELFGVMFNGKNIELVTPVVPPPGMHHDPKHKHQYRIGRFKEGKWKSEVHMQRHEEYELRGVVPRKAVATNVPCHEGFSPHPPGMHGLKPMSEIKEKLFCTWILPLPKMIHQLRLVSLRDSDRPVFTGDPHGDAVDVQLTAVSLAQAFEYEVDPRKEFGIFDKKGKLVKDIDYTPDDKNDPPTINLHIWAQLENELGMSNTQANEHASMSTAALVDLFQDLVMEGKISLSINDCHSTQLRMPLGIRYPELMTLAEKFVLLSGRELDNIECTGKTCGHGGNLFISSNP